MKQTGVRSILPMVCSYCDLFFERKLTRMIMTLGWALKRGYYTAKASRLDSYRGANHILRLALEGRICLCLRPPGFLAQKGKQTFVVF